MFPNEKTHSGCFLWWMRVGNHFRSWKSFLRTSKNIFGFFRKINFSVGNTFLQKKWKKTKFSRREWGLVSLSVRENERFPRREKLTFPVEKAYRRDQFEKTKTFEKIKNQFFRLKKRTVEISLIKWKVSKNCEKINFPERRHSEEKFFPSYS